MLHRTQHGGVHALQRARGVFPFPLLGIDMDNGSDFINEELLAYCIGEGITFTRGRVANKNDQCWVEQKNGSIVRQLVGYDRFEGERAYRQLAELYRAVRVYVNFFQPSMKLRTKTRTGSRVWRVYGPAQTAFQRVLSSGVLDVSSERRLKAVYRALDPVRLLNQVESLPEALWRHALFQIADAHLSPTWSPGSTSARAAVRMTRRRPKPSCVFVLTALPNANTVGRKNPRDHACTARAKIRSKGCGMRCARG